MPTRAPELTQAAFVKSYLVWHKIDHERALPYARRCLVNHKIDVWRATRHEVADLTDPGIGALGISVGTVKSAASRGLASLREHAHAQTQTQTQTQNASSSTERSLRCPSI